MSTLLPWVAFNVFVLGVLALDLGLFHRRTHPIGFREALWWSAAWVTLSLLFNAALWYWRGPEDALEFFSGYILEKSLSVDNLFVFAVVFDYMAVPARYQHKVLFWGVLGALVMRGTFIFVGVELVSHFNWALSVFGVFLLATGARLLRLERPRFDPARNRVLRLAKRWFPVSESYEGGTFFVKRGGRLLATPLLLVLILVEAADVVFATDSIPAIFGVTQDPFVIYSSNVLAILGLRSLYFVLAGAIQKARYLRTALAGILMFIGAKMLLARWVKIPVVGALSAILAALAIAILASWHAEKRRERNPQQP
jgi:TerC family integral membrane protein